MFLCEQGIQSGKLREYNIGAWEKREPPCRVVQLIRVGERFGGIVLPFFGSIQQNRPSERHREPYRGFFESRQTRTRFTSGAFLGLSRGFLAIAYYSIPLLS